MTVYLASYRGSARGLSRIVGAVIRWVTRSEFSHCEIAVEIGDGVYRCLTASGMDGGVRIKEMRLPAERWHLTPLPWVKTATVDRAARLAAGAGYDWAGVLRFAFPLLALPPHPKRLFCSELCAVVIGLDEAWRWTPADLLVIAERMVPRPEAPPE